MVTNKVQKIIQRLYDDFSTYDIFKLIDYLDITLVESDQLATWGCSWGNMITIRKGINEDIKEFVLAHELAHLILHANLGIAMPFMGMVGKYEKEANSFALLLLSQKYDISIEVIQLRLNEYYKLGI